MNASVASGEVPSGTLTACRRRRAHDLCLIRCSCHTVTHFYQCLRERASCDMADRTIQTYETGRIQDPRVASDPPSVCFSSIVEDARSRLGENAQQSGYEQVIASIPAKSRREKGDFALASSRARSFAPICPVSPEKSLLRSLYLLAGALFLSWVLCVHRGPHWHLAPLCIQGCDSFPTPAAVCGLESRQPRSTVRSDPSARTHCTQRAQKHAPHCHGHD